MSWNCILQSAFNNKDFSLVYEIFAQHNENLVIQQYIGVEDSKGVEIYDGDMILVEGSRHIVRFEECKFGYFTILGFKGLPDPRWMKMEVFGNIFQHAELDKVWELSKFEKRMKNSVDVWTRMV